MTDLLIVHEADVGVISTTEDGLLTVQEVRGDAFVTELVGTVVQTSENASTVVEHVDTTAVFVTGGDQGPPGIQGTAGTAYVPFKASGPLSGHRAVCSAGSGAVTYASADDTAQPHAVLGITRNAAEDGARIDVQFSGDLVESSWNWVVNQPVFLGQNGLLTQALPMGGVCLILGVATAPDTLFINIKQPIIVEG